VQRWPERQAAFCGWLVQLECIGRAHPGCNSAVWSTAASNYQIAAIAAAYLAVSRVAQAREVEGGSPRAPACAAALNPSAGSPSICC